MDRGTKMMSSKRSKETFCTWKCSQPSCLPFVFLGWHFQREKWVGVKGVRDGDQGSLDCKLNVMDAAFWQTGNLLGNQD